MSSEHYDVSRPAEEGHSVGQTLERAAYFKGYWRASNQTFVCKECRGKDGHQYAQQVLAMSREWPRDPVIFAMTAAHHGYVIVQLSFSFDELLSRWLTFSNLPPLERVGISVQVGREWTRKSGMGRRVVRPAKYRMDYYQGWSFPVTAPSRGTGRFNAHTDEEYMESGSTILLPHGGVFQYNEIVRRPVYGHTSRLVVEMARKVVLHNGDGANWKGPSTIW